MTETSPHPISSMAILYSFRRCPYAIRARMALKYSGVSVYLREVELKNKPKAMLECSAKGTVPILVFPNGSVIDESRDIMLWALAINDREDWIYEKESERSIKLNNLLNENDFRFKKWLDQYKYADRYPEHSADYYRHQGEIFLSTLEQYLSQHTFLMGSKTTLVDIGIFPFIRQFAAVDKDWFLQAPYPFLRDWLDYFLQSELFISVMKKQPPWNENSAPVIFGS